MNGLHLVGYSDIVPTLLLGGIAWGIARIHRLLKQSFNEHRFLVEDLEWRVAEDRDIAGPPWNLAALQRWFALAVRKRKIHGDHKDRD